MTIRYYDEVRVLDAPSTRELEVVGCVGVVLGLTEDDETGDVFCAVHFDDLDRTVMVDLEHLAATGRQVPPNDIYDGTSLRVSDTGHVSDDAEEANG